MKSLARKLRHQSTDAERLLWYHLRNRHLGGYKLRRQYIIEPYIVDFFCLEAKLIVEVDGGQHLDREDDISRTEFLKTRGYRVLRYWNHDILLNRDYVLEDILLNLKHPHPNPLPEGEGV